MPVYASSNGNSTFIPHPAGNFPAVCCDVDDLGMIEVTWQGVKKTQHKAELWWYCGQTKEDGTPLLVKRRFTLSLAENSNLRPFLETWRGKKFTAEELKGFDLEKLIGIPCFIQVTHNDTEKGTYANVDAIMTLPGAMKEQAPKLPQDFVRPSVARAEKAAAEAEAQPAGVGAAGGQPAWPGDAFPADDDLPF
jgi:hypothetical protein